MTFDELLILVSTEHAPRLCTDSRLVKPGDIFAAIEGSVQDGHDFTEQAIAAGAKYIVCQKHETNHEPRTTAHDTIIVEDSARAAALLAQAAVGNPASRLTNLAVTGTNGKTTVAFLVRSCIQSAGEKCGLIGTVLYDTGVDSCEATLTTPDCLTVAEHQQQMLKAGAKYMVIEASSHALAQNRLAAVDFAAAAFTNLAGDHLDYHKTENNYLAAKSCLFESLSSSATAVLNRQSPHALALAKKTNAKILWYAVGEKADITAHIQSMDISETIFIMEYAGQKQKIRTPLLGRFNVSNHLAAASLCLAADFDLETIATGLSALKTVPGRLERLDCPWHVFIDYAHTDNALENVLVTLKPLCRGRLTVVFGCGGDRDRTKRPRMAKVAEQFADFVIVTSDNPRTEQPEDIITQIVTGFENPTAETITIEPDRKKAVETALKNVSEHDIVLIAGKGHETYQIIGSQKYDFNDKEIARKFLKNKNEKILNR